MNRLALIAAVGSTNALYTTIENGPTFDVQYNGDTGMLGWSVTVPNTQTLSLYFGTDIDNTKTDIVQFVGAGAGQV